jgi:DNA-directed RNA polymerase subunit RPC12/RpoP
MREYPYECRKCEHQWIFECENIQDHIDAKEDGMKCPKCGSRDVFHDISQSNFGFSIAGLTYSRQVHKEWSRKDKAKQDAIDKKKRKHTNLIPGADLNG